MRKAFWRIHSFVGLLAAAGLMLIGITGSLLVFHEELDALLFPAQTRVEPLASGKLPLVERVAAVERQLPGHAVTGWAPNNADPRAAEGAYVMPFGTREWQWVTVDPYRGDVLTGPRHHDFTFKGWLLNLHYTFYLEDVGIAVTGLLGAALCFLGVSGIIIYRRFWKSLLRLRWRASARMLWGDVHRSVGVASVAFNLLLGFTGAFWNLSHVAEHLFDPHVDPDDEAIFHEKLFPASLPLDAMIADAATRIQGFETNYVSLPWAPGGAVTFWGRTHDAGWFRSPHGSQVAYTSDTGAFTSAYDLTAGPLWSQVRDAFVPLHFGSFGGLPVKILWALGGLAPAVLSVSGMLVWWKRRARVASPAGAIPVDRVETAGPILS
ncbi:PepSY-associated TM helix domain-containing protein [Opitutales bacterium ASA1]|uniref:PepSY-associated TM helix domain-containing protein n=1 Tax=Congregicoccus parvus TaxID=3081749 RepID=UPI002B2C7A60|nr:PepSY-associated TM helix domain-containing protein [Opitutales bacterium ASA1]